MSTVEVGTVARFATRRKVLLEAEVSSAGTILEVALGTGHSCRSLTPSPLSFPAPASALQHPQMMTPRKHLFSVLAFVATVLVGAQAASRAKLVNNGYENVVIGISPDISEAEGAALIPVLKDLVKKTSNDLFAATRRRAFFRDVKIVIPMSWQNTAFDEVAVNEKYQDSDIHVADASPVYQHQPYTLQPGDCGEPGKLIHLTPEYLTDDTYVRYYGKRSKSLTTLWASYRWGVFEEFGYPNDPKYPIFYTVSALSTSQRTDVTDRLTHEVNLCSDEPIDGIERVRGNKKELCSVTGEGIPDENCAFYPYLEQTANSSLMAYPAILNDNIVEFCDDQTHNHLSQTKQSDMCSGKSVWEVMLSHEDFLNSANPEISAPEDPVIKVVRESYANFVLVLDYSGSMTTEDRMQKLQKAAQQWLLYEVALHSSVAIVRFDSGATVLAGLTQISSDADRKKLADAIHTNNDGGTSIGSGLAEAVKILKGKTNKNIMVITDGEENENPRISDVFDEVVNEKICVITVAFGSNADQGLEDLALKTNCQSYTVNDNDVTNAMNHAFEGTSTRQPSPSQDQLFVKIYETDKIHSSASTYEEDFYVDSSIGNQLTFRLKTDDPSHVVSGPTLVRPSGATVQSAQYDSTSFVWTIIVPMAEEGSWSWNVGLNQDQSPYIQATVTSLQRDRNIAPLLTTVEFSAPSTGASAKGKPIKIIATVTQGSNPVVGAKVRAFVTAPSSTAPVEYDLYDNGLAADSVKGDGIYSRYMTNFNGGAGRYSVKALVTGGQGTLVNNGNAPKSSPVTGRRRRSVDPEPEAPPRCCGSFVPLDPTTATSTGNFTRVASGPSLKIFDPPVPGVDFLMPSRVTDLSVSTVTRLDSGKNILTLSWSAPGDDLDVGTVSDYVFRVSDDGAGLAKNGFKDIPENFLLHFDAEDLKEEVLVPYGTPVTFNVTYDGDFDYGKEYFVALIAKDEAGNESPISSLARFFLDRKLDLPEWAEERIKTLKKNIAEFLNERRQRS